MEAIISPVNINNRQKLDIKPGDTVRVFQKIEEKGKTRLQAFEGLVLARKHGNEAGGTFTVRRVLGSVGVEKIFPLYSPMIDKIEIVKRAKVRRAKLYYIRDKVAREIRRQMRNTIMMNVSSGSDIEEKSRAEEAVKKEEEQKEMEVANEEKTEETSKEEVLQEVSGDGKPTEEAPQEETKTDKVSSSDQSAKAD